MTSQLVIREAETSDYESIANLTMAAYNHFSKAQVFLRIWGGMAPNCETSPGEPVAQ